MYGLIFNMIAFFGLMMDEEIETVFFKRFFLNKIVFHGHSSVFIDFILAPF
jgi:hypothetical protein